MKHCSFFALIFILATALSAQAPQAINYQAIARNAQGQPLSNQNLTVEFSIHNGSISGNVVYREQHSVQANAFGLFTLGIGLGTPQTGSFSAIDWAGAPKFLEVNINNTLQGVTQLLSVPYALYAARAKEGQTLTLNGNQLGISDGNTVTLPNGGGVSTLEDLTDVSTTGVSTGQVLQWNGSQWVPVTLPPGSVYTAGNGIQITGATIENTGDTNPADDITTASQAGGDLTGPFSDLQIKPAAVGNPELADNAVGNAKIAAGAVTGEKIAQLGAANGQVLKWNGTTWAPASDVGGGTGDNWGSQVVQTAGATLSGNGTAASPLVLAQQAATNGQVLKWNGSAWAPASDQSGPAYTAGAGIGINGTTISNTGDTNAADDLTTSSQAGGDVAGLFANLQIAPAAVGNAEIAAGAVTGDKIAQQGAANGQVLKWNGSAWAPANDVGGGSGDNWGSQVVQTAGTTLSGNGTAASPLALAQQAATNGQVLKWNGTTWAPAIDQSGPAYTAGAGIGINGTTISNTGDTNSADDLTTSSQAGGDVAGLFANLQIAPAAVGNAEIAAGAVTGEKIAQQGAANGQVLKWNGTTWTPASDQSATVSAGTGISVSQNGATFTVTNNAPDQPITLTGAGATTVMGTYPAFTITTPAPLDNSPTNELQTLSLNGNTLSLSNSGGSVTLPAPPAYSAGTGISINGTVIGNTGDTNAADDITTGSAAGGDLSGTYPNPAVVKLQGKAVAATAPADGDLLRYNGTSGRWEPVAGSSLGWGLKGNSGTNPDLNFVGTTDTQPVSFRVNGVERMKLWGDGRLEVIGEDTTNTIVGKNAGQFNANLGRFNSFYGNNAGYSNTTGFYNSFYGGATGRSNTSGSYNSCFGHSAGRSNTIGSNNSFFGFYAGYLNTTGIANSFYGSDSGSSNTTGSENSFYGNNAGYSNTIGYGNSFYGHIAGRSNTTGGYNSFYGHFTGLFNTIGIGNSFFGSNAGVENTTGNTNSFYGKNAGENNTTGNNNCFMGVVSGSKNKIGDNNVCIGSYSNLIDTFNTNGISIGYQAKSTASNSARIGNSSVTSIGGQVNWTAFSDGRFKTGVQEDVRGLDFIRRLRPVTYRYDIGKIDEFLGIPERRQEAGHEISAEEIDAQRKAAGIRYSGFIAQEVELAARELGYDFSGVDAPDNDKDPYGLRYAEFTVPLVKAVQEQQAMIEALQGQLMSLQQQLQGLTGELRLLKAAVGQPEGKGK